MKGFGLPLFARLLLLFLFNLVFAFVVLVVLAPNHLELGWSPFLTKGVREHLQQVGESIASEMQPALNRGWRVDLQRLQDYYAMNFAIYDGLGEQLAGRQGHPPSEVAREMQRTYALMASGVAEASRAAAAGAPGMRAHRPGELDAWPRPDREGLKRWLFVIEVDATERYWVGIRTPIDAPDGGLIPATILASTPSFWHLVRFLDTREWVDAALVALAASLAFLTPLLWRLTRALGMINERVKRLSTGHFDSRIPLRRNDELGQLARSVNALADRLDSFVQSQQHFIANIAHEVASPLGRLQLALEMLKREVRPGAYEAYNDVYEEVQLMIELVNELLAFSRVGLGDKPRLMELSVRAIVLSVLQRESAGDMVTTTIPKDLQVYGDASLLVRAIGNLVRNSLRYGRAGRSPVELTAEADGKMAIIRVLDRGRGVPELALLKLGDAFYRPDEARRRETGGIGLGLATVKNCVAACGGSVTFRNRAGGGFEAQITLKRVGS